MAKWESLESGSRGYDGIRGEGIDESSQGEYYSKSSNFSNTAFESQLYVFESVVKDLDDVTAARYRSEVEKIKEELKTTGKISTDSLMKMNKITMEMDNIRRSSTTKSINDDFRSSMEKDVYSDEEVTRNYANSINENDKLLDDLDKDIKASREDVEKIFG